MNKRLTSYALCERQSQNDNSHVQGTSRPTSEYIDQMMDYVIVRRQPYTVRCQHVSVNSEKWTARRDELY